ncbi:unnamed protein product [Amoebophrya sp. A120]|nr:unnamed protein product [Amoebophrya sp. A120]|eukprot:GSA120T00006057001.1
MLSVNVISVVSYSFLFAAALSYLIVRWIRVKVIQQPSFLLPEPNDNVEKAPVSPKLPPCPMKPNLGKPSGGSRGNKSGSKKGKNATTHHEGRRDDGNGQNGASSPTKGKGKGKKGRGGGRPRTTPRAGAGPFTAMGGDRHSREEQQENYSSHGSRRNPAGPEDAQQTVRAWSTVRADPEISFPTVEEVNAYSLALLNVRIKGKGCALDDDRLAGPVSESVWSAEGACWSLVEEWKARIRNELEHLRQTYYREDLPHWECLAIIEELDLSSNFISDQGAQKLFHMLTELQIVVKKLLLFKNKIGDFGAYFLAYYLNQQKNFPAARGCYFVEEVHLSHNLITQNGCRRILEGLDEAHQYPIVAGKGRTWPLWIRINENLIQNAVPFVREMEQLCAKRRGMRYLRVHQRQEFWGQPPYELWREEVPGCAEGALFKLRAEKVANDPYFNSYPTKDFPHRDKLPIAHFLFTQNQNCSPLDEPHHLLGKNRQNPPYFAVPVCPYTPEHKILLVGEGDFSFTKALARIFGPRHAQNLIATTFDLGGQRDFRQRLQECKRDVEGMGGVVVGESVDCTQLHIPDYFVPLNPPVQEIVSWTTVPTYNDRWGATSTTTSTVPVYGLVHQRRENGPHRLITELCQQQFSPEAGHFFDYVIVNFLHSGAEQTNAPAGTIGGLSEHQELFGRFFASLGKCAHNSFVHPERTRVHVTLADRFPYTHWNIPAIAANAGWEQVGDKFPWAAELYQAFGYEHTRTKEARGMVGSAQSKEAGKKYTGETLRDTSFTCEFKLRTFSQGVAPPPSAATTSSPPFFVSSRATSQYTTPVDGYPHLVQAPPSYQQNSFYAGYSSRTEAAGGPQANVVGLQHPQWGGTT